MKLLEGYFGKNDIIYNAIDLFEKGVKSNFGDEKDFEIIKEYAYNNEKLPEPLQRLPYLTCCASKHLHLNEVLSFQASALLNLSNLLQIKIWAIPFFKMVVNRWKFLAERQKFLFSSPNLWAPIILEATSTEINSSSDCANLILLIGEAIKVNWPSEMLEKLRIKIKNQE